MATKISMDEWTAALEKAVHNNDEHENVFTTQELGEFWELSPTPTIHRVRKAVKAGLMTHTKKWVEGVDGIRRLTSAWKLLGKKGKQCVKKRKRA